MKRLTLTSLGQIREAEIAFGDVTVFVGQQASGKSILLQLVKLILDAPNITQTLKKQGFDWQKKSDDFLSLYFGEGMKGIWKNGVTEVIVDKVDFTPEKALSKRDRKQGDTLFFDSCSSGCNTQGWVAACFYRLQYW